MSAVDMPAILVDAATEAIVQSWSPETEYDEAGRAAVVAVLRALAGPKRGRDNHILMTGNILHTLADLTEGQS